MDECLALTPEEIDEEVAERRRLIQQMVGQLYPSILSSEIAELSGLRNMSVLERFVRFIDKDE